MKWFNELTNNEKKLVKIGSIIISIALLWVLVYKPINESVRTKIGLKANLQKQYSHMQSSEKTFKNKQISANQFKRELNQPFNVWIDSKLLENKLSQFVTRSEPKDSKTLILTFDSVIFDDLIRWLQPLEQNYNIVISEADIALTDRSNGLCNARITLEEK